MKDWWRYLVTAVAGACLFWGVTQYRLFQQQLEMGVAAYQVIGMYQRQGVLPPLQPPPSEPEVDDDVE